MLSKNSIAKRKRIYYLKNKEKLYKAHRIYIQNHSEARQEYLRKYWADPANKQKRRDYYKKNVERIREWDKAHYHKTKDRHSEVYRCRKFGLSLEEYRKLIARKVCDICGKPEMAKNKVLAIDHCHKTNKVRGILCATCNHALGNIKDDILLLDKMKEYLIKNA